MNRLLVFVICMLGIPALGQQRVLPIGTNFKDLSFSPTTARLKGPAVFPVSERDSPFYTTFKDSSKRYSNIGHFLYQRQLIEIKDPEVNAKLWITPLFDFSYGAEPNDTTKRRSQNTRGVRMEGTLGKRVFFTTSFYENQAFLPSYAADYVSQRGEQYIRTDDSSYTTLNAVIPGSARTKPFKGTGFDYAYATGMVSFFASEKLEFHAGNQPLFIGSGHRSMLWSDNSVGFPNIRARYRITDKLDLQVMRGKGLNLLRRPVQSNAEAYYEKKSVSFATLYYTPSKWLSIGVFEGGMWSRGDSLNQKDVGGLFYVPLPGASAIQEGIDKSTYTVLGADFRSEIGKHTVYGQFAFNPSTSRSYAYQAGVRLFPLKNPFLQVQLEYNHADENAYTSSDARINYSTYNLPAAHPMGSGFDEILMRLTWQKKYWFATVQTNFYPRQSEDYTLLMPAVKPVVPTDQQVINQLVELGYRFNREYGFEVFGSFRYRYATGTAVYERSFISIGIRTMLNNHYFDF